MKQENKTYVLLDGQRLTESELKKLEAIQPVIARWLTPEELQEAIKAKQDEN